eukprot:TRINITY_DN13668_c0_g1_i2.p1 TRINITY_DN13668_c0_g1~~TRINITY_DN13668_c0_g1_i2.p1  ORF type:complete len:141 (+),score=14.21 TRINITY_DN13668_c0_g1_i2:209-631(+)
MVPSRCFMIAAAFLLASTLAIEWHEAKLKVTVTQAATCSNPAKSGDMLTMHYTGTIDRHSATGEPGKKFDSSLDRGQPFTFRLGAGQVITGWDKGLVGICPGEKRTLVIPPSLGYGAAGAGGVIPGGATLDFSVECLHVN